MRSVKKILATALAVAMVTSVSVPVMAAEVPVAEEQVVVLADDSTENLDEGIMPLVGTRGSIILGESNVYTVIETSFKPKGFFSVLVRDFDPKKYQMDIILYGSNGKLWGEEECLHDATSRVFECGSEVTSVALRIIPRPGWFPAPARAFTVDWAVF